MKAISIIILLFVLSSSAQSQVKSESVIYQDGEIELEGYLSYDKLLKSKRGGVLIIHDKYGLNDFIKKRTEELAKLGYVAYALDLFGKDWKMDDEIKLEDHAEFFINQDNDLSFRRIQLGLENLSGQSKVDASRLAVIGYGLGGMLAMELGRRGENLAAIINFFGKPISSNPNFNNTIKCPILILIGSNDPYITVEELNSFNVEMSSVNNDWQINIYGNAQHGFPYYELGFESSNGEAYNYNADKRSWEAVKTLLQEVLK